MELIRTWILSVTVSAMVIAVAQALMPAGAVKKVGQLTGGLILVLGILQPLAGMDYGDLYDLVTALPAGAVQQEASAFGSYETMETIIAGELEAYIADKGEQLGAACTAQVTCAPGEGGRARPRSGHGHRGPHPRQRESLADCLEGELGIPRQAQTFYSEEVP